MQEALFKNPVDNSKPLSVHKVRAAFGYNKVLRSKSASAEVNDFKNFNVLRVKGKLT